MGSVDLLTLLKTPPFTPMKAANSHWRFSLEHDVDFGAQAPTSKVRGWEGEEGGRCHAGGWSLRRGAGERRGVN